MRFDPRLGYNKNRRGKGRKGRNTSFDRTLTNVSRVVGTGVSRDRIRKVGKCDPRIKVMALRGLFPGFQGIKEPPSAEPSLPPIPLSHGPRETTPSNYRFLKPRIGPPPHTHTHAYKETENFASISKRGRINVAVRRTLSIYVGGRQSFAIGRTGKHRPSFPPRQ